MAAPVPNPKIGEIFGRFTVSGETEPYGTGLKYKRVPVTCTCGVTKKIDKSNLLRGKSKSCGCLNIELVKERTITHGKHGDPIYAVWNMMKQRCSLPSNKQYSDYGGRGIKVCEAWLRFENFYADMGDAPFAGASLDRRDNNGNYCKDNCWWASRDEQLRNTRKTVLYDFKGQKLTILEIARSIGMNAHTLRSRIYGQGMSLEEAVTRPLVPPEESGAMAVRGNAKPYSGRICGDKKYT